MVYVVARYFRNLAGIQKTRHMNRTTFKGSAWSHMRLKPTVSCEYLREDLNLRQVNATLQTPMGRVVSNWQLWQCPAIPEPPAPGQYAVLFPNHTATFEHPPPVTARDAGARLSED